MARNFNELRAKMSPESRARAQQKFKQLVREMPLEELRAARDLTQEQLAETLGTSQAAVSKLERRADMYVSTLAHFVKAMGGELEIRAIFPDGEVSIARLGDLTRTRAAAERASRSDPLLEKFVNEVLGVPTKVGEKNQA